MPQSFCGHCTGMKKSKAEQIERMNDSVMQPWSTEAFCNKAMSDLRDSLGYSRGVVVLKRFNTDNLVVFCHCLDHLRAASHDKELHRVGRLLNSPSPSVIKGVINSGTPSVIGDVASAEAYIPGDTAVRSEICFPIQYSGKIVGAVNFENLAKDFFDDDDVILTKTFATFVSLHLNQLRNHQIRGIRV